jgi:hypothetical protein
VLTRLQKQLLPFAHPTQLQSKTHTSPKTVSQSPASYSHSSGIRLRYFPLTKTPKSNSESRQTTPLMSNPQVLDFGFVNDQPLLSFRPLFSEPVWNDRSDESRTFFQPLTSEISAEYGQASIADLRPVHDDLPFAFSANSTQRGFSGFKDHIEIQPNALPFPVDLDVHENAFSVRGGSGMAAKHEMQDLTTDAPWNDELVDDVCVINCSGRTHTTLLMSCRSCPSPLRALKNVSRARLTSRGQKTMIESRFVNLMCGCHSLPLPHRKCLDQMATTKADICKPNFSIKVLFLCS